MTKKEYELTRPKEIKEGMVRFVKAEIERSNWLPRFQMVDAPEKWSNESTETNLLGEVKNTTGIVDDDFLKAIEALMEKHKVNYVCLFWRRW